MRGVPYSVSVVLDRDYGPRLSDLLKLGPVWAIDSEVNRAVAQRFWQGSPPRDELDGLTVFTAANDRAPEDVLIDEFETIDLHHGSYSADPPYTAVRVIGTPLTERIRDELSEYGFNSFEVMDEGFRAARPMDEAMRRNHYPHR